MVLHNIINGNQIELVSDTARVLLSDATNTSKGDLNYSSLNNKISLGALGSGTVLALTTSSGDLDINAVGGHIQLLATGNPVTIATNVDGLGASGNIELTANGSGDINLISGGDILIKSTVYPHKITINADDIDDLGEMYLISGTKIQIQCVDNEILMAGSSGIAMTAQSGNITLAPITGVVQVSTSDLDLNTNDLVNGGNLGAETMVLTSNLAKAEFKDALGVLKGSMGFNSGTGYMDLTGSAGFEINTTAGDLNMEANGGKINMTTNGNNIEIFGNTTGGVFADINIGSSDGVITLGTGGEIVIDAPIGDVTITSLTLKIPTLANASTESQLFYNTATKEVSYGPAFPAITVQSATGTIALTASMNRSTYILTGTSATQTFSVAGLSGVPAGWCVYLRNGNNTAGTSFDITITIPAGSVTLHNFTGTTNSSFILLYWTGSALVAYR
jgi:hypothetical protein